MLVSWEHWTIGWRKPFQITWVNSRKKERKKECEENKLEGKILKKIERIQRNEARKKDWCIESLRVKNQNEKRVNERERLSLVHSTLSALNDIE